MQQEIKLTNESSNTVFVDDVDVSKGVYFSDEQYTFYIAKNGNQHVVIDPESSSAEFTKYDTLREAIEHNDDSTFYTIPDNKRIVTERGVTIEYLKNTDHVGIMDNEGIKGMVVIAAGLKLIWSDESYGMCNEWDEAGSNMNELEKYIGHYKKVYRFTTRKELYQWLAE